jgi:hypothetical protein
MVMKKYWNLGLLMKHSIGPESIYIKKKEKGTVKTVSDPHMKHSF